MITENDKTFIKMVAEADAKIHDASLYIKEHYNVDSTFNADENILTISKKNTLKAVVAKEYIESQIAPELVSIVFE